ncbi:protein VAPYRIN-LIKE-like [Andrographis paniculata]|uniref:protein VAPYRIN-LIKE-like n=1 Tax=Andrographis paniculata TaxID=175694 RepID=UPI0021E85560|nr:protein VAPYRIN-LIKE-like [Andrographis paniculata]
MDRLIKPEFQVIDFLFAAGRKCSQAFKLSNLMHTMPVAVSLTVSDPSVFSFAAPFSIIPPLSTASFCLLLNKPLDAPPLSTPPATVTVRSSMLPTGKALHGDLRRLFSKPGPHIFKDAEILISFVGADVAEFLLSPPAAAILPLPEIRNSFFCKAIAPCDAAELNSLLRIAAANGKVSSISALISAGAAVNSAAAVAGAGESLISSAVASGSAEAVRTLIESGCEIDAINDRLLHSAAARGGVDLLQTICLSYADIDLNSGNSQGQTAVHIAAINSQTEALQFLLSIGGDPDISDDDGWTALHYAADRGDSGAVEVLLRHSSFSKHAVTKDGKTAFALAAGGGHSDLFDALQLGDELQRAARSNDVVSIERCVLNGAKIDGKDQNGWTALHRAAFKGHMESVEALIRHGARIDVVDGGGYTPLLRAVEAGRVEIAMFLLSSGAKTSLKSIKGMADCGGGGDHRHRLHCHRRCNSELLN